MLVGALAAGSLGDWIGRRRIMLINLAWFSIGMGATALTQNVTAFGIGRFVTGIGVGALVATVGALVAEFAPPGQRNRLNAVVYSGVPAGGVLASVLALVLTDAVGWRGLFWVGALPIVLVLPLAIAKLPESAKWLAARGRLEQARALSERTGVPLVVEPAVTGRVGFPALATRALAWPTALLGLMSFAGLLLTYGLNTWLPKIMEDNGYGESYSLAFLLVLNLGAIIGGMLASLWADRAGAKRVVVTTFVLAAVTLALLPLDLPLGALLLAVAVAGVGTIGTQVLVYGLVSNYYPTRARAAGWRGARASAGSAGSSARSSAGSWSAPGSAGRPLSTSSPASRWSRRSSPAWCRARSMPTRRFPSPAPRPSPPRVTVWSTAARS
ncbi:MFS transporter [Prauserella oleivorans]